jgi:hypothetical protein
MSRNREIELGIFEEFKRLLPGSEFVNFSQPDPPAPDALLDHQGRRVGIEITRHLRPLEKQQESEVSAVVASARAVYTSKNNPPVGVSAAWVPHSLMQRSDRRDISEAIAATVAANLPQIGAYVFLELDDLPEILTTRLHYIRIHRLTGYADDLWAAAGGGGYPSVTPEIVRQYINSKEAHFANYHNYCEEVWLLIAADGSGPSSWCEMPPETKSAVYDTRFSRLFFMLPVPNRVVELPTVSGRRAIN